MNRTASNVYESLRTYVAESVLHGEDTGLDGSTPLLEWGVLDSLAMVGLLTFIEGTWGFRVPDDDVKPAHFIDLNALTRFVLSADDTPAEGAGQERSVNEAPIRALEPYGVSRGTEDVEGGSLHYLHTEGEEPTWVLLPALGNPASSWGLVLRNLSGERRAFAFDLAGFGLTTAASPAPTYADQLALVLQGIERLTTGPLVLLGHSAGAMIAAEVARRHPERVRALIVTSFGAIADPEGWWSSLLDVSRDPDSFVRRAYYTPPALGPALRRLLQGALEAPAYRSFLDEEALAKIPTLFRGLRVPTLFLYGEEDRIVPRTAVESAVSAIPGAHVEWLSRCGHFPQVERPQELFTLAQMFVSSLPQAAAAGGESK